MSDSIIPDPYRPPKRDAGHVIQATEDIQPTRTVSPTVTAARPQNFRSPPESVRISSLMSASDIAMHLGDHGCKNLTDQFDIPSCTTYPISSGGFGDVYHGRLKDGTTVAIKAMRLQVDSLEHDLKPLKTVAREIHTWSKCQHPNVVELLGLMEFRGQIGMVSLWMDNGNLLTYLSQHPYTDRYQMGAGISEGLAYLHRSNIVHGDLKGLNVLVSNQGIPMLADFGNAVLQERTLQFTHTTTKKSISPRWAAPEIIDGSGTYSRAGDVYALGMTLLEAVTGKVPYPEKNDHAVYFAVALKREHPKRPEDHIPPRSRRGNRLWSMLIECWAYDANARPSAVDVLNTMEAITHKGLIDSVYEVQE